MAFDDPLVWVLIIAVVVFLFGANKIPGLAKAFGQAKKEFSDASKSTTDTTAQQAQYPQTPPPMTSQQAPPAQTVMLAPDDPLVIAAQREGIDTHGKTREQIASELSWKLNRK
jgi:TatA/E family protein of Tat protein translocase